jgi:hypothetical protein
MTSGGNWRFDDASQRTTQTGTGSLDLKLASLMLGSLTLIASIFIMVQTGAANPDRWRNEGWERTDFSKRSIEWDEIQSGGPPKDGIPSIDNPQFKPLSTITDLAIQEAVIGLSINGDVRAYPIRILMWHEIVNDRVGGVPVAVTYCPLCNAAIVFDRRNPAGDGVLSFGTTGKLRNSDLVMYDRQTQSWWQQFSGEAIVGKMTGQQLKILPSRLEAFGEFRSRQPGGQVLIPSNPELRAYGRNPYASYDTAKIPFLYRGNVPKGIEAMARVVALRESDFTGAISLKLLREQGRIEAGPYTIRWKKGQASALDDTTVAGGRDVGNVIAQKKLANGTLEDVPYDVTFAFVFHAFHPDLPIVQSCDGELEIVCPEG